MPTPRELLTRLRTSPRLVGLLVAVVALTAAAVLDVPGRLASLAPADQGPTPTVSSAASPSASPPPQGRLSSLTNADNQQLDRCTPGAEQLARCGPAPALGDGTWFGTDGGAPLQLADLRGSVVLVDFLSGSCVSCRRFVRYLNTWQKTYGSVGLRVIGVHSPEHDFERDDRQVGATLDRLGIGFPVVQDRGFATLTDYRTQVLPSTYVVDAAGTVRAITLGEGGAARIERQLRTLLRDRDPAVDLPEAVGTIDGTDVAPGTTSPIDLGRSDGRRHDTESDTVVGEDTRFRLPPTQPDDTFSFGGLWTVGSDGSVPREFAVSRVSYRGRTALQVVGGTGTLTVTTGQGTTRRIDVDGPPDLVAIAASAESRRQTLTVRYEGDLRVYAFSFG